MKLTVNPVGGGVLAKQLNVLPVSMSNVELAAHSLSSVSCWSQQAAQLCFVSFLAYFDSCTSCFVTPTMISLAQSPPHAVSPPLQRLEANNWGLNDWNLCKWIIVFGRCISPAVLDVDCYGAFWKEQ